MIKRITIFFDSQDPKNKGWAYAWQSEDDYGSYPLNARRKDVTLKTLRRQAAADLGKNWPSDARKDENWTYCREDGGFWVYGPRFINQL